MLRTLREAMTTTTPGLKVIVADGAVLCPSFYKAEIVQNPSRWDRLLAKVRGGVIGWLQGRAAGEHSVGS
jgi:hypothetical protein